MPARLDVIGLVVEDMARSLAFYRRLGLDAPAEADQEPHVEVSLPGGLRLAFDTEETIRSFDPEWTPPSGGDRMGLAFLLENPAEVDQIYAELTSLGYEGYKQAVGCVLGSAIRHHPRSRRRRRLPVRPQQRQLTAGDKGYGRQRM